MKILHVTPYVDASYGGPGVAVRAMAESMAALGARVEVAVTNAAGSRDLPLEDGHMSERDGVGYHFFRRTAPRSWFRAPAMSGWLAQNARAFDVVHLHVPFTAPFRWAALAARAAGVPYVVTPHGVLDPWSLKQKAWKKAPYLRFLERGVIARAAALHVTAPLEAGYVGNLGLGPPIYCIPLAVEVPPVVAPSPRASGPLRILCVARLHPVKAIPVLLKAVQLLVGQGISVVLDLAGDGDPGYARELHRCADDLGLGGRVVWHGHVDGPGKRELYAGADCFALLSFHENFGLAAAEAMAEGLPVVVSDQVGLAPDVLAYRAGVVVPTGDVDAAAEAFKIFQDPRESQACREAARRLVVERYGRQSFQSELESLYGRVLGA